MVVTLDGFCNDLRIKAGFPGNFFDRIAYECNFSLSSLAVKQFLKPRHFVSGQRMRKVPKNRTGATFQITLFIVIKEAEHIVAIDAHGIAADRIVTAQAFVEESFAVLIELQTRSFIDDICRNPGFLTDNFSVVNLPGQSTFRNESITANNLGTDIKPHLDTVAGTGLNTRNGSIFRHVRIKKLQQLFIGTVSTGTKNHTAFAFNDNVVVLVVLGMNADHTTIFVLKQFVGSSFDDDLSTVIENDLAHCFDKASVGKDIFIDVTHATTVEFSRDVTDNLNATIRQPFDLLSGTFDKAFDHYRIDHVMAVSQKVGDEHVCRVIDLIGIRKFSLLTKCDLKHH